MKKYIFDIETAPLPLIEIERFIEVEPAKNLKDPVKIAEDVTKKKADAVDRAALSALTGRVCAIGWMDESGVWGYMTAESPENESNLIGWFFDLIQSSDIWIGHNIAGFDVPFLIRRYWALFRKPCPVQFFKGRYLNDTHFKDTMQIWSCGNNQDRVSLNNLHRLLGGNGKEESGKHFYQWLVEDKSKAYEYLENDLRMTRYCAEVMGLIGPVAEDDDI